LKKLGVMTTPVTVIDGEIVVGFDQAKLEQLLRS
jgi:pseudouridine-5'-phosphate glycosidase